MKKVLPIILLVFLLVSCCTSRKAEAPAVEPVLQFPDLTESVLKLHDAMPRDEEEMDLTDPMTTYWAIVYNSTEFEKAANRWRDYSKMEEGFILDVARIYPVDLEPSYSLVFALVPVDAEKEDTGAAMISYYYKNFAANVEDHMNWKEYGLSLLEYIDALADA